MAIPLIAMAAFTAFQGLTQKSQASRIEKSNIRPTTSVDPNILKNQATFEFLANQGLNASVENRAINQMNLGLSSGLRAQGLYGRGGINANSMLRTYNQGVQNLAVADEQARERNLRSLTQANQDVARENQRVFNTNFMQPYQQTREDVASLRRAGTQNIFGGLSALGQGYMMGAFGGQSPFGSLNNSNQLLGSPFNNASLQYRGLIS